MDLQGCCSVLFRGPGTELTESPSEQFSYIYSFSSSSQELSPGTSLPMHALLSTQEASGPLLGLLLCVHCSISPRHPREAGALIVSARG